MLYRLKPKITEVFAPLAVSLSNAGITPHHISIAGFLMGICASILISLKMILVGAIFLLLSGIFDIFDGTLARATRNTSSFGRFLDPVLDRYVDILIFISFGLYGIDWLLVTFAMSGALFVSYTRAKAEATIGKCDEGIGERPERLIILILGMVCGFIYEATFVVCLISHFTVLQRIFLTYKKCKKKEMEAMEGFNPVKRLETVAHDSSLAK
jgi:archaetidylinositol phosphate synthase